MHYYFSVLKKYAVFAGRARRAEYWYFFLFNAIAGLALNVIGLAFTRSSILASIYSVAVFIPSIAVSIRRMHDINKSGWYILIPIYNVILTLTDGTKGNNTYGSDPKEI